MKTDSHGRSLTATPGSVKKIAGVRSLAAYPPPGGSGKVHGRALPLAHAEVIVSSTDPKIVVVGGVAGGASAAARARRVNERASIVLLERGPHVSFANCGLPYYIGGEIERREALLLVSPKQFKEWLDIEVRTRHDALRIDRERRVLHVRNAETGEEYEERWDKLILSPGAAPFVPPKLQVAADNVFTLRNLADTDGIKGFLTGGARKRAVVLGAGFIGLEMVEMLRRLQLDVTLVELQPQVLPVLHREMAQLVQDELERNGVHLRLGQAVTRADVRDGHVVAVELTSGELLPTDVVIVSVGVRPDTQLASEAGLALGDSGGIAVDEHMRTSDPSIYAVGDAVEYQHMVRGGRARVPLAGPANKAGRVAGEHAATGQGPKMPPVLGTAIVRAFGVTAAITGGAPASGTGRTVYIPARHHAGYYPGSEAMLIKLQYEAESGRLTGAQIVGGLGVDKRIDVIATAISLGGTVDALTDLDLAYAPPFGSAKDPIHMAGFAAQNAQRGLVSFVTPPEARALDALWVDVAEPHEWPEREVYGALNVPLPRLRERLGELDRARPLVVVCAAGKRAYYASRILEQHGFTRVHVLAGGVRALRQFERARI